MICLSVTAGDDKRENKKDDNNDFGFGIPLIPIISSDVVGAALLPLSLLLLFRNIMKKGCDSIQ